MPKWAMRQWLIGGRGGNVVSGCRVRECVDCRRAVVDSCLPHRRVRIFVPVNGIMAAIPYLAALVA